MFHRLRDWGQLAVRELWEVTKQATGEAIGKKAVEKTTETIFRDLRGELLTDIVALPHDDTRNIWRRHQEAMVAGRENRFVTLLTKIPREKRPEVFINLDRMTDTEFEQTLYLLEHDVIPQTLARVKKQGDQWAEEMNRKLQPTADRLRRRATKKGAARWLIF